MFRIQGLGFEIDDLGFRIWGTNDGVLILGFRVLLEAQPCALTGYSRAVL